MPSTCCVVPGCSFRGGHRFPSEKLLQKAWLIAIKRVNSGSKNRLWTPTESSVVNAAHFLPSDYKDTPNWLVFV